MKITTRNKNKEVYKNLSGQVPDHIAEFYSKRIKKGNGNAEAFFNLKSLADIKEMVDSEKAADKIVDILLSGGKIAAVCDYDSDGCHSAAVIVRILTECGYADNIKIFTPNRMTDGYGANPRIIREAKDWGAELIVTADNGIAAFEAAEEAEKLGLPFIVTDHHLPSDKGYPKAYAIVDPARDDCGWQGSIVCGATVAFLVFILVKDKLVEKGVIDKDRVDAKRMFQLIGAATIADCVPMVGINRSIVQYGLKQLTNNPYPGYKALLEAYDIKRIDEQVIGFKVGPAINSAGRLSDAAPSITFLITEDVDEAKKCADSLVKSNKDRKGIQDSVIEGVMAEIEEKRVFEAFNDPIYVFGDEKWHHGVVGIVAGRITEKFSKPSFVFGGQEDSDIMKGSGRSGGSELHLKEFLDIVDKHYPGILVGYGGHSKAAGCSIHADRLEDFADACNEIIQNKVHLDECIVYIDNSLEYDEISKEDIKNTFDLLELAPFGQEFSSPDLEIRSVPRDKISVFGKGKDHITCTIGGVKCIGFGLSVELLELEKVEIDMIVRPNYNYFRGSVTEQFFIDKLY